jgi:hypothetical protein
LKVRADDGVNVAITSASLNDFEIAIGPPDSVSPRVDLLAPRDGDVMAAGATVEVRWSESDNVAVVRRVVELSTDGGETFIQLASIPGPTSTSTQRINWTAPPGLQTNRGKFRVSVFDGSNNIGTANLVGKFQVWSPPVITSVNYRVLADGRKEFEVGGSNFRLDGSEIHIDGVLLKKIKFFEEDDNGDGTFKHVYSYDKKLHKRVPEGKTVNVVVKLPRTGQTSEAFQFKRKKN